MTPPFRYAAFGLCIASDIALPQLGAAPPEREANVSIRRAPLAGEPADGPSLRRRQVAGLFRYECRGGVDVDIDLAPGADPAGVADMISGRVVTVIAYQRGLLPLHAGAVETGAGLVAIAGPSGAGKSTLTAALTARGLALAADDMVATQPGAPSLAAGGARRLKLSPASLACLGWPSGSRLSNDDEGKYLVAPPAVADDGAGWRPLRAVFCLGRGEAGLNRLEPLDAAALARRIIRMPELINACGQAEDHWRRWLLLVSRTPIIALGAPDDLSAVPALAGRVAALLERELT
jgi:hypothetical protein